MKKYLGIDYGGKRVGLALADDGGIALPFIILELTSNNLILEIKRIVTDEDITDVVIGWPISLNGRENERTGKTQNFIDQLESNLPVIVHKEDERLTTEAAKRKIDNRRVDAQAAAEILQTYLDKQMSKNL